jgi:hypothetical protein
MKSWINSLKQSDLFAGFYRKIQKTMETKPKSFPGQRQDHQPGKESEMNPKPEYISNKY